VFTVEDVSERHIDIVGNSLRDSDVEELRGFYPEMDGITMLKQSVAVSEHSNTWIVKGKPIAICGLSLHSDKQGNAIGVPWMVGTNELNENPKVLIRASRMFFNRWLKRYKILSNYVPTKSTATINYLKHLGFNVFECGFSDCGEPLSVFIVER